jgi:predicted PurR-regulated permease PerM
VARVVGGGTTFFFGFMGDLVLISFFMVFIMLEMQRFGHRLQLAYGDQRARGILEVMASINLSVQRYLWLKVAVSFIIGVLATLIMAPFGLDFYALLGVLTFLLNFIPYLGAIIATVIPVLLAIMQFESPLTAVWLGVALLTMHQVIGNYVEPLIQGRSLNLSPLVIMLSLAFWGWLWGLLGMVLAVPFTVGIRIALEHVPSMRHYAILMSNAERIDSGPAPLE